MDGATVAASPRRPRSAAQEAHSPKHTRYTSNPETREDRRAGAAGQTRANGKSDVIPNLIFSLSSISDQSEQMYERLLPVSDKPPRPPSRNARRVQANNAANKEAPPPVPTLVREEVAATGRIQPEQDFEARSAQARIDTNSGRLPAVQEVASPVTSTNTAKSPVAAGPMASTRSRSLSLVPQVAPTDRTMSMKSARAAPNAQSDKTDTREAFASISITPGKTTSESIASGDSGGKRMPLIRSSSKPRTNKDKIRELDAERKKRAKASKGSNIPKSGRSPNIGKVSSSPGLPSPALPGEDNFPGATANGYPRPSMERGPSRGNLGHVPEDDLDSAPPLPPFAGSSDQMNNKRPVSRPGAGENGVFIPPRASSTRQSIDMPGRASSRASSAGRSRAGSRANRNGDVPRVPLERSETDTNKRIQELIKKKEGWKEKEEEMLAKLREPSRPVLSDIMPNGGVTKIDEDLSNLVPPPQIKRSTTEERAQRNAPRSILNGSGGEARDSFQMPRSYSQPSYGHRPRDADAFSETDSIDEQVEEYVNDPRLSQSIYHPQTKRCISYSDVGDPNGAVIVCCIGMGTTRFVAALYDELAQSLGLRLITPERPGIGESEPCAVNEMDTPLAWPDDLRLICQHLNIKRYMLLAHSAGAVYALATALRMPGEIRGRIHILAPWIPPSQFQAIGQNQEPVPVAELPLIQRILRSIPEPLLEAATRIFNMSSLTSSLGKSPYARRKRRNTTGGGGGGDRKAGTTPVLALQSLQADNLEMDEQDPRSTRSSPALETEGMDSPVKAEPVPGAHPQRASSTLDSNVARFDEAIAELTEEEREQEFQHRLTANVWHRATSNANPAIDLMICLERKQDIGFRYEDITKPVVLHHGTKDTRVSVENVVWIGERMRRCDVRVLEGEGHGLMASASVMSKVLGEMAQDWEDWNALTRTRRY